MFKIGVIGSTCIDKIILPDRKKIIKNFGGVVYLLTALSVIFKNKAIITPVTKIEKKYKNKFIKLLQKYKNINTNYVYQEPKKTNIVTLKYDKNHLNRCEKSILKSSSIKYKEIEPILNSVDILIITFISGYDITLKTLTKIRKNYKKIIYGDIHSLILTKSNNKPRKFKNIKKPDDWIKNFDILQGNLLEWKILLKNSNITKNNLKKLIITQGDKGVIGIEKEKIYKIDSVKIKKVIDTTGCGDTFTAGMIYGILNKLNFKKSLRIANYFAYLKAKKSGFFKPSFKFNISRICKIRRN